MFSVRVLLDNTIKSSDLINGKQFYKTALNSSSDHTVFCVRCVYKGIPLKPAERYALHNLCGLSEVELPLTTDLISDY